jgi:hypothetical protein
MIKVCKDVSNVRAAKAIIDLMRSSSQVQLDNRDYTDLLTVLDDDGGNFSEEIRIVVDVLERESFIPDAVTYIILFKLCATAKDLIQGQHIHVHLIKSKVAITHQLYTVCFDMYAKCDNLEGACSVFTR